MRLRFVPVLLWLGVVTILAPYGQVMSQSYTTFTSFITSTNTQMTTISIGTTTLSELTTSTLKGSSGEIPSAQTGYRMFPTVCFYFPYQLHLDASVKEVDGVISASSPINYFLMSEDQYNQFVSYQPPCGSSYASLSLEYSVKSYVLKFTPPGPGDFYILLENTSTSNITYNMQLSLVQNQSVAIYSTSTTLQAATSQKTVINTIEMSSSPAQSILSSNVTSILAVAALVFVIVLVIYSRRTKTQSQATSNTPG